MTEITCKLTSNYNIGDIIVFDLHCIGIISDIKITMMLPNKPIIEYKILCGYLDENKKPKYEMVTRYDESILVVIDPTFVNELAAQYDFLVDNNLLETPNANREYVKDNDKKEPEETK